MNDTLAQVCQNLNIETVCPLSQCYSPQCNNPQAIVEAYERICSEIAAQIQEYNHAHCKEYVETQPALST